jgi:filamentous hemagglutinin family protein
LPAAVLAGPKNGQVVAGAADISTPDANTTVIRQSTDKSVINWQSFSIGSQEYVKFVQPDKSSLSLNRVIGGDPSSILGKLSANGQVYLVNPNGIYFGQGAQVDVSAIVASVLDISNADFMSGNFVFQGDAEQNLGKVINDGIINARNEGYVVLLGDYTENNGVIQAQMGKVVLASGSHLTMDISGNNLISVAVDEAVVSELAGVKNSGEIYADGGRVIMTARVADNLIGSAVNNEGLVRASSIVEQDGAIFLTASGGNITNSGTLDASAVAESNADGGGVLVYSDKDITLASGGAITARGDGGGAGGVVRVIAEDVLDFQAGAVISVAGSPQAGGFVEISGHGGLVIRGDVDTGSGGDLVIDPAILTITNSNNTPIGSVSDGSFGSVGKGYIEGQLNSNTNVTLIANSSIAAAPGSLGSTTATFEITALAGNGNLSIKNGTVGGSGSFANPDCSIGVCLPGASVGTLQGATGNINLATVSININGGLNIAAGADVGTVSIGAINAGGNVSITAGSNINLEGVISAAGTSLAVTAGNAGNTANSNSNINVNGGIGLSSASPLGAEVTLNANNNVNIDADIFLGNNTLTLTADYADGTVSTGNGVGDVNINGLGSCTEGCFGEPRTVTTRGALSISGVNLNVNGADFGPSSIFGGSFDIPVRVSADDGNALTTTDNITVNLTGQMTVRGGRVNTRNAADVSVKVSAGNDVSITAVGGLSVTGGTAIASTANANSGSATALADATLSAGRNMTVTIATGSLLVQGGTATANVIAVNTSGCGSGCTVTANANASVTASNVSVTNVGTTLSVTGGTAEAAVTGSIAASASASANANATINASTQNVILNATGAINLNTAGQALANGNWNVIGQSGTVGTFAQANVTISAANNVVVNAGTGLTAAGGVATATPGFLSGTGSATASARLDITAGNLVDLSAALGSITFVQGTASAGNATLPNVITADAVTAINADNFTASAGNNLQLSGVLNNTGVAGGAAWSVQAANDINMQADVGAPGLRFNDDLSLTAGNDVNIDGDIFLSNRKLTLAADSDTAAGGDVNIVGSATEARRIDTQGSIDISGVTFNLRGATLPIGSNDAQRVVNVSAGSNVTINVSGQALIQGGTATGTGSIDRDVSVQLSAGNDLTVSANGLFVQGGNVAALASSADSSVATVKGNVDVSAGRDISLTLSGALSIAGGNATATAYARFSNATGNALAGANAVVSAGRDVVVNSATGLAVSGGSASATVGTGSASCLTCGAAASANASLSGQNIISVGTVTGNISFNGGNANGVVDVAPISGSVSFSNAIVNANARALVSATQNVTLNASGSINVFGGSASVNGSLASASIVAMNAAASATVTAGNDISLNASGSNNVFGGFASVGGVWTSAAIVSATADVGANVTAGNNVTMTSNTELKVIGGFATASPINAGSTLGNAAAGAAAAVMAGGLATINVTSGSISVFDGSADSAGTSPGSPARTVDMNARILAGSLNLSAAANLNLIGGGELVALGGMQISAGVDVVGSSAGIFADGLNLAAGNNVSLVNTTTIVGNGTAPGVSGDTLVLDILDKAGIGLPANNNPNAMFEAGGSMFTGDVNLSASNGYLWFSADQLTVGSISAPAGPLLVQYSPFTPTRDIAFEDLPASPQPPQVNYDNSNHVALLPMTTLVIGSAQQSGPMTVGANGLIDIGARNILLLTTPDSVTLPSNIITTGIVATSGFVGTLREEVFVTPRLENFDVEVESWWLEAERRKQQVLENGDNNHGMCTAL